MRKHAILAAALAATTLGAATPALSQDRTEIGILDCIIEGGADIAVVTSKDLSCTFDPAGEDRPPEAYFGVVNKIGLEIGATSEKMMRWAVLAPTADAYAPGALADDYVGASAEVTAGIGGGANLLVSETNKNLVLQPLSVQAQTGLNLAVGVSEFQLRSTAQ